MHTPPEPIAALGARRPLMCVNPGQLPPAEALQEVQQRSGPRAMRAGAGVASGPYGTAGCGWLQKFRQPPAGTAVEPMVQAGGDGTAPRTSG